MESIGDAAAEEQRLVTEAGNPARPEGEMGARMLERMNESHGPVTDWALGLVAWGPGMRALDVGCGGGATMRRIWERMSAAGGAAPGAIGHVTGVDYSEVSCEQSRAFNARAIARGEMDVVQASVESLPFPDGSFERVTTVESFYFWPDALADLREVARVMAPGGRFLLVADVYRREGLPPDVLANIERYGLRVLDPQGYLDLFERAGFSEAAVHVKPGTTWIAAEGVR